MQSLSEILSIHPSMNDLYLAVAKSWPEHDSYLTKSLTGHSVEEMRRLERLSSQIRALAGARLAPFIESYRWLCGVFNEEQIHFIRNGRYRRTSFAEAEAEVYSNKSFMQKYMEGLLISQLFWSNHAKSYLFHDSFLSGLQPGSRYLEIGPGHGLYLATAALHDACTEVEAWDVSEESLAQTEASTRILNVIKPVRLVRRNVLDAGLRNAALPAFDVIVISEVLEHLEKPQTALTNLRSFLNPGGQVLVNFPINSPAPDHIYLLNSMEAVQDLVSAAGFTIESSQGFPATGYTLERAMDTKASVSCAVIGRA